MPFKLKIILSLLSLVYFLYTLSFAIHFYKTADKVFDKKIKVLHLVLIWLFPFLWIIILKGIIQPRPTRWSKIMTTDTTNITGWTEGFYNIFHSTSHSNDSSGDGSHGHDSFDSWNSGHHSDFGDSTDGGGGHH